MLKALKWLKKYHRVSHVIKIKDENSHWMGGNAESNIRQLIKTVTVQSKKAKKDDKEFVSRTQCFAGLSNDNLDCASCTPTTSRNMGGERSNASQSTS